MALRFIGIDPETNGNHCPAVFVDELSSDLVITGLKVADPQTLAEVASHSPIADHEGVFRLPARMRDIVLEAVRDGDSSPVQ